MSNPSRLCFEPASALAKRLQRRELSALELAEVFLNRIARLNAAAKAYITVTPDLARRSASASDQRLARGEAASALLGIPFATKDLIDIEGVLTTGGSAVLHDNIATRNAAIIDRMNASGAVSLGKTNLHEFAYGTTGENALYGTAVNAYDPARLACGSSSGSAAAVAHGLAAFALGTDTGGSVRIPAVLNGLVGLKPTFGRLPMDGVVPYCWSLDHLGLITRTVADCMALFRACADLPPEAEPDVHSLGSLRIGIPDRFYFERADPEILTAAENALRALERAGARIAKVAMPEATYARTASLTIQMPEALSYHMRYLDGRGALYSPDFRAGLALGQYILAEHYVRAKRLVTQFREGMQQVFTDVDAILTPATPIPAPKIGTVTVAMDGMEEAIGNALTRFTAFFNMTGHPAVTLATTIHSLGLPIGVQLVGRYGEEALILRLAAFLQESFGPPPLPNIV
ncbi:amidase [Rhodoligotrophos defluvii]|uniref:amidase n=1 Tax=Rhodoligotrophos defluvii TaxID=2561934 RepID=UPI0010C974D1|nr:amidase [Rhodoligotrophos defluvii]